jgi:hypothetical protein
MDLASEPVDILIAGGGSLINGICANRSVPAAEAQRTLHVTFIS